MNSLLLEIRRRPGLYLGEQTLTGLWHFLHGFHMASGAYKSVDAAPMQIPEDFNDWVAYKLHFYEPTAGWKNMILSITRDEVKGFDLFFQLLDEHSCRKRRVVAQGTTRRGYVKTGENEQGTLSVFTIRDDLPEHRVSIVIYAEDCPGLFEISDDYPDELKREHYHPSIEDLELIDANVLQILDAEGFSHIAKKVKRGRRVSWGKWNTRLIVK